MLVGLSASIPDASFRPMHLLGECSEPALVVGAQNGVLPYARPSDHIGYALTLKVHLQSESDVPSASLKRKMIDLT